MKASASSRGKKAAENRRLRERLAEAEETLRAIRAGEVDALVMGGDVYSLKGAETPYRLLIEAMNEGAATLLEDGTLLYANRRLAEMLGRTPGELGGAALRDWVAEGDAAALEGLLARARLGASKGELRLRGAGGAAMPVQVSCAVLAAADARALCAVVTDLTERRRAEAALNRLNRALRTISACDLALVHAETEGDLLREVCAAIVREGGHRMAWVGYAEQDEAGTLRVMAKAGAEEGYLEAARVSWSENDARGRGPTGRAVREGAPRCCADTQADPDFAPWREAARRHGFATALALPLAGEGRVFGALSIYSGDAGAFGEEEKKLLGELAGDLAYGIAALRAKEEHRRAEERIRELNSSLERRVRERTRELARSGEMLRRVLRATETGTFEVALAGGAARWNDVEFELLGLKPGEAEPGPATFLRHVHPDDLPGVVAKWEEARRSGRFDAEFRVVRADGSVRWLAGKGDLVAAPEEEGEEAGPPAPRFLGINFDITERKRTEEALRRLNEELTRRAAELEAANKELEAFAYSVSHDLRAPLRSMDGFSKIALEEHAAELKGEAREALEIVRESAQQMGRLIDDLLVFSRLSRQPMRKETVKPRRIVEDCLLMLRDQTAGRRVEVSIGDLPECRADPGLLELVWMNLLSNALKYSRRRDPARIEIGSRPEPDGTTGYYVKDNGVGFNMAYAHKLFGVFQRLHRAEEYEGTGVGLATAQRIVARHGGRIRAEAEPDKGATFIFTLEPASHHEHAD